MYDVRYDLSSRDDVPVFCGLEAETVYVGLNSYGLRDIEHQITRRLDREIIVEERESRIAKLSNKQRQYLAYYLGGFRRRYKDVAEHFGVKEGTIKSTMHQIKAKIGSKIGSLDEVIRAA